MDHRNLTKAQLSIGDIVYLGQIPGDIVKPKTRYHNYRSFEFGGSDLHEGYMTHDSPPPKEKISEELKNSYTVIGLERGFCDHPGIIIDLLTGSDGDDSKVVVCSMSSRGRKELTECIENSQYDPYYLAVYPRSPTVYYPNLQLKLEHDRIMRKAGYVDYRPRPFPISMLERLKNGCGNQYEIGDLRLDQESIEILRAKSGYSLPNATIEANSYPTPKVGTWGATHLVTTEKAATSVSHSEHERSCFDDDEAASPYFFSWRLLALGELTKFLLGNFRSGIGTSSSKTRDLESNADAAQGRGSSVDKQFGGGTSTESETPTSVSSNSWGIPFGRSFSFHNLKCSFINAFTNELEHHTSKSLLFTKSYSRGDGDLPCAEENTSFSDPDRQMPWYAPDSKREDSKRPWYWFAQQRTHHQQGDR